LSQSILLTMNSRVADNVREAVARLIPGMARRAVIERALQDNGAIIVAQNTDEIISVIDRIAPEHLELLVTDADAIASRVRNAGAIFIGPLSAESLGDYCAGPNHVLPTSGTARFSSPLGVYDFQKRSSIIEISAAGADVLVPTAVTLARSEGLDAHARSAEYRHHRGGNGHDMQESTPGGRRSDKI
jgi:histidinol dehydrogenase